jgi:hypothetical protein
MDKDMKTNKFPAAFPVAAIAKHTATVYRMYPLMLLMLFMCLCSCENVDILCPVENLPLGGDIPVKALIHWDEDEMATLPSRGMRVHLFPETGTSDVARADVPVHGGLLSLPRNAVYSPVCYDYYGAEKIEFRNPDLKTLFEAYCVRITGLYNTMVEPIPGEQTVAEPCPYTFYTARNSDPFTVLPPLAGDTLTLHYYPANVVREFTFLIYGVQGAKNMAEARGAISGMAASYFPGLGVKTNTPSIVLFDRVTPYIHGQKQKWATEQKQDWPQANENARWPNGWDDETSGWTGDWVMGTVCTFGPVDPKTILSRLTIETLSNGSVYYHGSWGGYADGRAEDEVAKQLAGATGDYGARAEQSDWRRKNGGFDIILYNNGRLVIPDDENESGTGGFVVSEEEWNNVNVVL